MKNKSIRFEAALFIGMVVSVFCAGFCSFAENYNDITDSVFRIHILANSDEAADQAVKLKVRDAVLEKHCEIFEGCKNSEEAAELAARQLDEIKATAEQVLAENGFGYDVNCEVTEMDFDTREYDFMTMPAGNYKALRITIGDAAGKNWWCVMFPPLCIPAVSSIDEALAECEGVFTEEELEMLSNPENYECRFYILELIDKIKKHFDK